MSSSSLTLVLGIILSASFAFSGGSRVGNGGSGDGDKKSSSVIMSLPDLDMKTEIPLGFNTKKNSQGDLVLSGPGKTNNLSIAHIGVPMQIKIQGIDNRYPQLKSFDQRQWMNWFNEKNWKKLNENESVCPRLQFIQNADYGTIVVAWGSSDGVAVTFDNLEKTRKASKKIIESLNTLNPDKRCTWK